MRRPRAFTCSRLGAEPPPPPTRKPLGYSSLSSPCRCGTCDRPPPPLSTPAVSETSRTATIKLPRKDVLVSSTAEKTRFRRLPRGGSASSSTAAAAAAAAARKSSFAPIDESEQRKPKRGSDRGDLSSSSGVVGGNAAANSDLPLPLTKPAPFGAAAAAAAATDATFATPAAAGAGTAAAAAAAAATPVAVSIDGEAAGGEKKSGSSAAAAAAASLLFEAGSNSVDKASASVTFIHFDQQGRPSLSDLNFVTGGSETSTSSSSSSSAGGMGVGVGLDKWKAPPTSASGIFSVGASSSQAAAAAVGRRRRRVGG